jgi:hypothetical protein
LYRQKIIEFEIFCLNVMQSLLKVEWLVWEEFEYSQEKNHRKIVIEIILKLYSTV